MSNNFNPGNHTDDDSGDGGSYLKVAGDYLIVIKNFNRGRSKNKKPFVSCMFKVIWGERKGQTFNSRVFLNQESLWKLGRMCQAMQYTDTFDLDSDRDMATAIRHRPFKVRVTTTTGNKEGMVFCDLDRVLLSTTPEEEAAMEQWIAEFEAAGSQDPDDSGFGAPDGYGGFKGRSDDYANPSEGGGARSPDDDIPF